MTIRQIQSLLSYLGYVVVVDGFNGPETVAAVRAFQTAEGLTVDCIPGAKTWAALKSAVANDRFSLDKGIPASGQPPDAGNDPVGDFWGDIRYFTREEFRCKCGGKFCGGFPVEPEKKLVRLAERVREHFGNPITVSSGVRCPTHNANVGGVANSRHLNGKAMDFCVSGFSAEMVLPYVQAQSGIRYAYAINGSFVHMDVY